MWSSLDEEDAAAAAAAAPATTSTGYKKPSGLAHGLASIPNLRDVASAQPSLLRAGTLFRCACVDFCSAQDAEALVRLGMRTRIDLRHEREMAVGGQSWWFRDAKREPRPCSDALRRRPEVQSHHLFVDGRVRFQDEAAAAAAAAEVSAAAAAVSASGTAAAAASDAPASLPMVLQYVSFTEHSARALGDALRALVAAPPSSLSMVHCSAGKDRTGVVVAFVLLLCGGATRFKVAPRPEWDSLRTVSQRLSLPPSNPTACLPLIPQPASL